MGALALLCNPYSGAGGYVSEVCLAGAGGSGGVWNCREVGLHEFRVAFRGGEENLRFCTD